MNDFLKLRATMTSDGWSGDFLLQVPGRSATLQVLEEYQLMERIQELKFIRDNQVQHISFRGLCYVPSRKSEPHFSDSKKKCHSPILSDPTLI